MKGLLLKDFYMTIKYCKFLLLIIALFIVVSVFDRSMAFWVVFPIVLASTFPVTIMSYDERCGWMSYSDTLPCTRTQVVSSKYILSIIAVTITGFLIAIVQAFLGLKNGTFEIMEYVPLVTSVFSLGLISPALMMPVIFKFGVEKGRIMYYLVIALFVGLGMAFSIILSTSENSNSINQILTSGYIVVFSMTIIIFAVSWLLSIQIYKNRELDKC